MVTYLKETLIGLGLAIGTILPLLLVPKERALDLVALLLVFIAAVYMGFALRDGRPRELIIEIMAIVIFTALSVLGLWITPYFLVAGYFLHGVWDVLHHPKAIQTEIVPWYPPFCLIYDWVVGGFIFLWWDKL